MTPKLVISTADLDAEEAAATVSLPELPPSISIPSTPTKGKVVAPLVATPKTAKPGANGTPPGAPSAPEPQKASSWMRRNATKFAIAGGAVTALAGGFIAAFVLLGVFDSSEQEVQAALSESNATFAAPLADVNGAPKADRPLTTLQGSASDAGRQVAELDRKAGELEGSVDDGRLANPALELIAAEQTFLDQFSEIGGFKEDQLKKSWTELQPQLEATARDMNAARASVSELGLAAIASLAPTAQELDGAISSADGVITEADKVLTTWEEEVTRIQEEADGQLAVAEGYQASMPALIQEYYDQRDATRALMERSRVFWVEASDALRSQADARAGIISRMQALAVPPGAESAHQSMVSLASESQSLLTQAASTTETDPFPIWTGSPGYNQLSAASDGITARFDPARAAVDQAGAAAVQAAQGAELPPKPKL